MRVCLWERTSVQPGVLALASGKCTVCRLCLLGYFWHLSLLVFQCSLQRVMCQGGNAESGLVFAICRGCSPNQAGGCSCFGEF